MLKKLPPFHTLAAFEAVARHRSFAGAARELSLTQSAISHRISNLEQYLGTRCVMRGRGQATLTPQGAQLLIGVREAMSALQNACMRLQDTGRQVVRLSVGPAFARNWLIEKLGGFYREHAEIDLEINAVKLAPFGKLACLKSGEADVAIRYGSDADWSGFTTARLLHSEIFPVCGPGYCAQAGPFEHPSALRGATLLRLQRQPWTPWFRAAGIECEEPVQGPWFSDAGIMLDAAANGQGVALARRALVDVDLNAGRLVRLFNISITADSAYYAICRSQAMERPEVATFVNWLVATTRS